MRKSLRQEDKKQTITQVLTRIQHMRMPNSYILMTEHWDWLTVLQCLQDHQLFKSNPQRPPLASFELWVQEQHIPQELAHCSVTEMSLASRKLKGQRYPWTNSTWEPATLKRWRDLYRTLDRLLTEMEMQ